MLTNIFYYGYYKPYIMKTSEAGKSEPTKRERIAERPATSNAFKILLNKTMKQEVREYARGVSDSVVSTKESSKNTVRDMTEFNKNAFKRSYDTAKMWIQYDLEEFASSYNDSTEFLSDQKHSQSLRSFSERLTDNVQASAAQLEDLGLSMNNDGKLNFNVAKFNELSESRLNSAIGESINVFQEIYNDAGEILTEPLKEHMNFKNLGYYYNYKLGRMESDTFKMIESGMLVDLVV